MAYDDQVGITALLIQGRYPQAHMKNPHAANSARLTVKREAAVTGGYPDRLRPCPATGHNHCTCQKIRTPHALPASLHRVQPLHRCRRCAGGGTYHLRPADRICAMPCSVTSPVKTCPAMCVPATRLCVHTDTARFSTLDVSQLSYGFVAGPGRFETTLTRPTYGEYYPEQFRLSYKP